MKKPQLFLLHFAGGNCYSFQFLIPYLTRFDVVPIELPGRGKRTKEPLIKDFIPAAEDIYNQIKQKIVSSNYMIYGHSMGSTLGLRVSSMLEENNTAPVHLIVSGNCGPGIEHDDDRIKRYLLDDDAFIEELKRLGGIPDELLENKELMSFFEPILRADFETLEKDELNSEPIISLPIYAMMGTEEKYAKDIENWKNYTNGTFNFELLEGDHFFIHKHPKTIAKIIETCYDSHSLL